MPLQYPKAILKPGRESSVKRFHPWVFSGAIAKLEAKQGVVEVISSSGEPLGVGYADSGSISVKMLAFKPLQVDAKFFSESFADAHKLRASLNLEETNCFRLIFGEADGIPGLIVDCYDKTVVFDFQAPGLAVLHDQILSGFELALGSQYDTVIEKKSDGSELIRGQCSEPEVRENGIPFIVNCLTGQKTGFFLDQRENRALVKRYAKGRSVLNLFSYTGGFSSYALAGGASRAISVDASKGAIELAERNVEKISAADRHQAVVGDCFEFLTASEERFELIIVDPPAFAKHKNATQNAIRGYKQLNSLAFKRLQLPGLIFTFSCSQLIDRQTFYHTVMSAAVENRLKVRVLHELHQAPCHPSSLFHPEGTYLKGFVLGVSS